MVAEILRFFSGDVRVRGVVLHHCDGCCASVEEMLSRLKSILQYFCYRLVDAETQFQELDTQCVLHLHDCTISFPRFTIVCRSARGSHRDSC